MLKKAQKKLSNINHINMRFLSMIYQQISKFIIELALPQERFQITHYRRQGMNFKEKTSIFLLKFNFF